MTNNEKFCQMLNSCRHPRKIAAILPLMHLEQAADNNKTALLKEFESILQELTPDELEKLHKFARDTAERKSKKGA